jgi:hypothetical protein
VSWRGSAKTLCHIPPKPKQLIDSALANQPRHHRRVTRNTTRTHSLQINLQTWRRQRNARRAKTITTTSVCREGRQIGAPGHARTQQLTLRRKTGITLADKGVYDEHGLEPISGIFSSPERSPPKRGDDATGSGSMEIQESA